MTATLFNYSYTADSGSSASPAAGPPPVRSILIVGGGTAGWMTALILARSLIPRGVEITVLESPTVGIIGVGEGSTPWLRGFFDSLGIEEAEWMPACHATYKCGITFDGWSTKPGFESYFHPFASMLDNLTMTQFVHNVEARVNGANVHAHPDRFFIAARLAAEQPRAEAARRASRSTSGTAITSMRCCSANSCSRRRSSAACATSSCHVTHATLDARRRDRIGRHAGGRDDRRPICSSTARGFAGLLIDKALQTPFVSFANNLFNDAAVALPSPIGDDHSVARPCPPPCSTAGRGRSRSRSRYGNGYVYSTQFCSPDEAETRAARAPGAARGGHAGAPPEDEDRPRDAALEPQLPGGGAVAGIHRAAGGDGWANDYDMYDAWTRLMVLEECDPPKEHKYTVGTAFLRGLGSGLVRTVRGLDYVLRQLGDMVVDVIEVRIDACRRAHRGGSIGRP